MSAGPRGLRFCVATGQTCSCGQGGVMTTRVPVSCGGSPADFWNPIPIMGARQSPRAAPPPPAPPPLPPPPPPPAPRSLSKQGGRHAHITSAGRFPFAVERRPSAGHRTAGQSPHSRPGMRHGRRRGADGGARKRYGTPVRNTGQPSSLTEMAAANGVRCASRKSHMSQRSSHLSGRFGRVNDRSSGHGVIAGWALS